MRKMLFALMACLVAIVSPSTAQAQSLEDVLGAVSVGTQLGFNPCSFTRGSSRTFCQVNRAANVANTLVQIDQNRRFRRNNELNRRTQQLDALQRACQAGDEESCMRSGGGSQQQMQIARALIDACNAGDRASCRRARDMMDERNISRNNSAPYLPTDRIDDRQNSAGRPASCLPQDGYMVDGQFFCSPTRRVR